MSEIDRIRQRYDARNADIPRDRYSFLQPDVFLAAQAVDEATMALLQSAGVKDLAQAQLLEVGCGSGGNLLRFLRWGFSPENLVGNELLEERAARARECLPAKTRIVLGDARALPPGQFDIVYQSTVLSSILDKSFQAEVAAKMWQLTRPGGLVLSYDFTFNNPQNPDVQKVTRRRLRQLFPEGELTCRRITLAPPLARRTAGFRPGYVVLNALPLLRTHSVCTIRKPVSSFPSPAAG